MAYKMIAAVRVITVFVCIATAGNEAVRLPIKDCSTGEMDVLFLYCESDKMPLQKSLSEDFVRYLASFPTNNQRLMFAAVSETFIPGSQPTDVSLWMFFPNLQPDSYKFNNQQFKTWQYRNTRETVELKKQFVHRLFSEMRNVRKDVIKIGVIFLDCVGSPQDDRSISIDVQQPDTDINIFVMSVCDISIPQTIRSRDVYQLENDLSRRKHILTFEICNQCKSEWFLLKHSSGTDSASCYKLFESGYRSSDSARNVCVESGGNLASIESMEELSILRARMYSYIKERRKIMNNLIKSQILIHFGLYRDPQGVAKKFKWFLQFQNQFRPVLVNNWKTGKSSPGFRGNCGVWEFIWKEANVSNNEDILFDYWSSVDCWNEISSLILCEVIFPRSGGKDKMVIKPATNESLIQALKKGYFIEFNNEIISVSANIGRNDILNYFKLNGNRLPPLYDCGKDAGEPQYVSFMLVCDYTRDCRNGRDETACVLRHQDSWNQRSRANTCGGVYCCDGSCLHLQWVNDGVEDCPVFKCGTDKEISDEYITLNKYLSRNETCALICNHDQCVNFSQLNDGHKDCEGPEGPLDETIGKLEIAKTCYNILNESIWAPKCVYVKDMFGAVLGCSDMSHINNCTDYACPLGYSKCPNTYCIPQHYVLDGDSDCPTGQDELYDNADYCFGNFHCSNSKICLHPDRICDGHPDCPRRDDELDCRVPCPVGFCCESGTITPVQYNKPGRLLSFYDKDDITRYLDLSGLDLSALENITFPDNLHTIIWSNCKTSNFPNITNFWLFSLYKLDISNNLIKNISDTLIRKIFNIRYLNLSFNRDLNDIKYLLWLQSLETLDLSYTGLLYLDKSIRDMPKLNILNLSCTGILYVSEDTFSFQSIIQTLDLRGTILKNISNGLFKGLTVSQRLYVDSFQLCCAQIRGPNIPDNKCQAPDNVISSCSDLVGVDVQRVLLWSVAVLAVIGNITVIVYRIIWDRSTLRIGYGLFVTNLGISDFIMGVYLFIIAGADHYYRDIYFLYDMIWKESLACRFAGFLATLSCETSTFFVFLITLDRFLVIKFPFGQIMFSKINKIATLLFSWVIGFLLAVLPLVFEFEIYSSNAMCLGLPLTTKRLKGWEFSFGVFVVFNLIICFLITYGQRAIFKAMSENRITDTATKKPSRRASDIIVGKQLSLIALSNFLCWFPVGIMGFLSLLEYKISNDVYAWTTVIIIPINSAANPLLYTIPALMDRWNKFKFGG